MNFISFFKGLGHFVLRTFSIIRKIVPEAQLLQAIKLAQIACDQFVDNGQRKDWVAGELKQRFKVSDSVANFLVELAVQHLKADVIDKAAGKLVVAVEVPNG